MPKVHFNTYFFAFDESLLFPDLMCYELYRYCDCFANGEFCSNCNCNNCANNLEHEDERSRAIKSCLERNPLAFHPKIGGYKTGRLNIFIIHYLMLFSACCGVLITSSLLQCVWVSYYTGLYMFCTWIKVFGIKISTL